MRRCCLGPLCRLCRYLGRIGYDGAREPTLATLRAIVACHTEAIAFENLSPLTGVEVRLKPHLDPMPFS